MTNSISAVKQLYRRYSNGLYKFIFIHHYSAQFRSLSFQFFSIPVNFAKFSNYEMTPIQLQTASVIIQLGVSAVKLILLLLLLIILIWHTVVCFV